ncbi:hypothetical protein BHE74_00053349, partial [Ensete ventricosum]
GGPSNDEGRDPKLFLLEKLRHLHRPEKRREIKDPNSAGGSEEDYRFRLPSLGMSFMLGSVINVTLYRWSIDTDINHTGADYHSI